MRKLIKVLKLFEEIYKKSCEHKVCIKYANFTEKIVKGVTGYYGLLIVFSALFMIATFFISANRLTLPIVYPKTDFNNTRHVILTLLWQLGIGAYSLILMGAFDVIVIMTFFNLLMVSALIIEKIHELEKSLRYTIFSQWKLKQFREIFFEHREFNK